jgi:hypothetical protein
MVKLSKTFSFITFIFSFFEKFMIFHKNGQNWSGMFSLKKV